MDYKSIYSASLEATITNKEQEIISTLKESKKRNKNFRKVSNHLKELIVRDKEISLEFLNQSPDLYNIFKNRYNEYDRDHLESFLEEHSNQLKKEFVEGLGRFEGLVIAEEKYRETEEYLETAYALNEGFDQYILNFSPGNNPVESDFFYQLKQKRFPGYGKEISWEIETLKEAQQEDSEEKKETKKVEQLKKSVITPGSVLDKSEKRYILHLLYQLLGQGSEIKATEFVRILHLTVDIIDTSADITGNPTHYRQVHEGFPKDHPKNEKIALVKRVISKIQGYKLPKLKQILNDKLIAFTKEK